MSSLIYDIRNHKYHAGGQRRVSSVGIDRARHGMLTSWVRGPLVRTFLGFILFK